MTDITSTAPSNGVIRCTACGASETRPDGEWLVCAYCRHRWLPQRTDAPWQSDGDIGTLMGTEIHAGAAAGTGSRLVTLECSGCGAEVGINTDLNLHARCHWCRHELSLNAPVDNGAVPDAILPFAISREDAQARMWSYVASRWEFATAGFKADFATYPIAAVYLPYFIVDGNVTVRLDGQAWVQKGAFVRRDAPDLYETDIYAVMREADLEVDDLAIEARSTRSRLYSAVSTTNIINALQPFDVKNALPFDARYIGPDVNFEPRDTEVDTAMSTAAGLFATMARGYVAQTLTGYTGHTRWDAEQVAIRGTRWVSMLLPVWLYGYQESTPRGPMMHYIAVNGRTGEVQGSVPVDQGHAKAAGWKLGLAIAAFAIPCVLIDVVLFAASGLAAH